MLFDRLEKNFLEEILEGWRVRTSLSLLWKFVEESEVNTVLSVSTFPTGSGPAELLNW